MGRGSVNIVVANQEVNKDKLFGIYFVVVDRLHNVPEAHANRHSGGPLPGAASPPDACAGRAAQVVPIGNDG